MLLLTNNGGDTQLSNGRDGALTVPTTNEIQSMSGTNGILFASLYMITENFNTVKDILIHWNDEAGSKVDSRNTKWNYHLSDAQNKIKYSRE